MYMNIQLFGLYEKNNPCALAFVAWGASVAKNVLFQVKNVLKNILFFSSLLRQPTWGCNTAVLELYLVVIEWHHPYPFVVSPECSQEHSFFVKQFFLLSLRHVLFQFLFKCKCLYVIIWYSFQLCPISKVSSFGET